MKITFDRTISDISKFIQNQGFYYTDAQIYDFYVSLKTKPFVIISGISGSGKSKIADLFAEYMAKSYGNSDNYEIVSVKPNWTDNRGIFGFPNLLNSTYSLTGVVKLFIRALQNPLKPYFLVLDEMNLAKVEYYFSDFLSLLESRRISEKSGKIYSFDISKLSKTAKLSLPQITLLAAVDMDMFNNNSGISKMRENRIYKNWMENHPTDVSKVNWTPRSRTELNSKDSSTGLPDRVSPKFFVQDSEDDESYRLLNSDEFSSRVQQGILTDSNMSQWKSLLSEYFIISDKLPKIHQEEITLHENESPLPTVAGRVFQKANWDYSDLFDGSEYFVPSRLPIPLNIFVIGTVNVDETTYMFSPKVLDRSNVIEFNEVDLFKAFGYGVPLNQTKLIPSKGNNTMDLNISIATSDITKLIIATYPQMFDVLNTIFEILKRKNKHFGYRVFNEISSFIFNYVGKSGTNQEVMDALDLQVLQKVLPKINGTEDEILSLMEELNNVAKEENLVRSQDKIDRMITQLTSTGYATYIE
ncbi:AAA family ATPase [Lactococcus lactis]|uniref:AAA family ATPase n=1 Tax=Lactococcus lactis TaxID=1358 RepID=UPI0021A41F65|nr:AAA family ATPase [Lactococcus lactis]MCT3137788.1 hypothetical protein [Lactococcus lactis]